MRPVLGGLISLTGFALLMAGRTDTPAVALALVITYLTHLKDGDD
jgi:hypothetical protein